MLGHRVRLFLLQVCLFSFVVLLTACASRQSAAASGRDLRLDTYSTHCGKNPAACSSLAKTQAASRALTIASRVAPAATLFLRGAEPQDELEQRLVACAVQADLEVNRKWFGGRRPQDDECLEEIEVEVDGCMESMTRAAALGREKHAVALACVRKWLGESAVETYSIEPRYRFYRTNRVLEHVSLEEEKRLLAKGCSQGLWRTIKPDLLLQGADDGRLACRVFDFKFPCLEGKRPQWTRYGKKSAFAGSDQGTIYSEAFGCKAVIISPVGVIR
jgi:hypothetical protein